MLSAADAMLQLFPEAASEPFLLTEADDLLGSLPDLGDHSNNHAILGERRVVPPTLFEEELNASELLFFPKKEKQEADILQQVITEIEMEPDCLTTVSVDSGLSANSSSCSLSTSFSAMDTTTSTGVLDLVSANASTASLTQEDDTKNLIEEVEEFLVQHENIQRRASSSSLSSEDDHGLEMKAGSGHAERLLEALVKGNVSLDENKAGPSLSNVSEIVTADGQRIVIVIAKDDEVEQVKQALSPDANRQDSPEPSHDEQDSDWSPDSPRAAPPAKRAKAAAKGGVSKPRQKAKALPAGGYGAIKDKKERKKLQNVVAARRYRDKKKSELACVEEEESALIERNNELKAKLSDVESEVNTLKKLMAELGLIKVANAARKNNC